MRELVTPKNFIFSLFVCKDNNKTDKDVLKHILFILFLTFSVFLILDINLYYEIYLFLPVLAL